jgi:hypothetical protein
MCSQALTTLILLKSVRNFWGQFICRLLVRETEFYFLFRSCSPSRENTLLSQ